MKTIFIDTGAYLARFYRRDQSHERACELWDWIEKQNFTSITTNHVMDELATLLGRRTDYCFAARKVKQVFSSELPIIERSDEQDEKNALRLFEKYADQKVSFTDCLSFAIMQRLKIKQVFSFDQHFKYAGFELLP